MRNGFVKQAGYSVIELVMVTGIMAVVSGMAVVADRQFASGPSSADGAMRVVLSVMNQAKQLAITQRTQYAGDVHG